MIKRWDKPLMLFAAGTILVGCSLLTVQVPGDRPGSPQIDLPAMPLRPGLAPVTVDEVKTDGARIRWSSPWEGKTTIWYGRTPKLVPVLARRTAPIFTTHTELSQLAPDTRYYFMVEVQTPMGVARSAVLSFRTR